MSQPLKHRRRRSVLPPPAPMPVWQRLAAAALFLGLGGGTGTLGTWELVRWLHALGTGAPVIETDSFILGLPLLGFSLLVLGPAFLLPRSLSVWLQEQCEWLGTAVLLTMLVGLVLTLAGQIVINMAMEIDGYRACHVGGRGRYLDVTWTRDDTACPPGEADRR